MNQNKKCACIPSIRVKLLVYFICFTAVGLLALFLFQSLFLGDLYEWMTVRTVKNAATEIANAVQEGDVEEVATYWNIKERVSVLVASKNGQVLFRKALEDENKDRVTDENLEKIYELAAENGGAYLIQNDMRPLEHKEQGSKPPGEKKDKKPENKPAKPGDEGAREYIEGIVYVKIVENGHSYSSRMVLVSSLVVPVEATLRTLQVQFFVAVFVLTLMAALFSIFVSGRIARPISNLNRAAKQLANDCYQSPPPGSYREAAELRQTLEDTARELKKTQRLQNELIANLSHDLRTPLTMITGYSEAIRDFPEDDVAENIQVVIDEANRLTDMVSDILDLSRLQAGTEQIITEPVNLTQTLCDTVRHFEQLLQMKGYHIEIDAKDTVTVKANNIRLSQIVYNLLDNALAHAGEDKTVKIMQTVQGKTVCVSVTDHGEGIPEDEIAHIWERYYRARSHKDRPQTGRSGLGLSIVKTLVQLHDGEYGVESERGKGSTFWFSLPLYEK